MIDSSLLKPTSDGSGAAWTDQLRLLREAYASRLDEKLQQIEIGWTNFLALPEGDERREALVVQHRLTHSLAGSGATFGYPAVSDAARRAEIVLKAIMLEEISFDETQKQEIEDAYSQLRTAASEEVDSNFGTDWSSDLRSDSINRALWILCSAQEGVPAWAEALEAFGYNVHSFFDANALLRACQTQLPAALIVNCEGEPARISQSGQPLNATLEMLAKSDVPVPVIWTCENGDLRSRLQSVRLGGAAFFTQPVDTDSLLVKLDDLTARTAPEPLRVLIVDDEPSLARLFSLILRQSGMETCEVISPLEVMTPLVEFRPDLILMDVYMPGCKGTELAAVIRQQEAYLGIPIVFLSVETDVHKQQDALRYGGDDFLIKPIQPRHLVSAVTTRATRARVLRNLMVRDSLTGLLNHTKTKEQLNVEMDRVRRLGHTISLAMIDLDHFKVVNDTYGHSAGDRVLRSLARLLQQRMRQTDVIGRYGGEEFAVIMSGADSNNARRVLDDVLMSFASLNHCCEGQDFRVSFSAGIASSPPIHDAASLSEAADRALYEAKSRGRSQVVVAR
jgi:diguanylate cyclase (GGDEF)-like protein